MSRSRKRIVLQRGNRNHSPAIYNTDMAWISPDMAWYGLFTYIDLYRLKMKRISCWESRRKEKKGGRNWTNIMHPYTYLRFGIVQIEEKVRIVGINMRKNLSSRRERSSRERRMLIILLHLQAREEGLLSASEWNHLRVYLATQDGIPQRCNREDFPRSTRGS